MPHLRRFLNGTSIFVSPVLVRPGNLLNTGAETFIRNQFLSPVAAGRDCSAAFSMVFLGSGLHSKAGIGALWRSAGASRTPSCPFSMPTNSTIPPPNGPGLTI
jgi:hypothetical protein